MSPPVVLAIDSGTSSCKVVLYRGDRLVAAASEPTRTARPGPGLAEQDPADWWAALTRLVPRVVADHGADVDAIGVTAQSDSLVVVDDAGDPVYPCILWMDGRGDRELGRIREALGEERIRFTTGLRPALSFTAPKVAWLQEHEPDAYRRTRWVLQPKDYLVLRLTGVAVTDPSSASRSMLMDRRSGSWWPDMVQAAGIDAHRLPAIVPSGSEAGRLTVSAAHALGLRSGIPVTAGAADRAAEALASGVTGDEAMVSMGTATGIVMSIRSTDDVEDAAILTPSHALAGRSLALMSVAPSGAVLDWLLGILVGDAADGDARSHLIAEAAAVEPGAGGLTFLPFLQGAKSVRWDQAARGVVAGLDLSAGRGTLIRAALEGMTFEADACLRRLATSRGRIGRLVLVGGGQRDELVGRLLVDVTGISALRLDEPHAGAAGAMLLAGQAIGAWPDPAAFARSRRGGDVLAPDREHHVAYRDIAARYEALCDAMDLPQVAP